MFERGRHSSPKQLRAANGIESVFSLGAPFSQARYTLTFCYVLAMVSFVLLTLSYY